MKIRTDTACLLTSRRLSIGDICRVVRRRLGAKIIARPCDDMQLEASCCATLQYTTETYMLDVNSQNQTIQI